MAYEWTYFISQEETQFTKTRATNITIDSSSNFEVSQKFAIVIDSL